MPILNIRFGGKMQAPDGTPTDIPPKDVLAIKGPCVQISVGLAQSLASQLLQQGGTIPAPVTGYALIDTEASITCVDQVTADQLRLPVIDVVNMASASHAATQRSVYPIHVEFIGIPIEVDVQRAIGAELAAQGIIALIGRDVLTLHVVLQRYDWRDQSLNLNTVAIGCHGCRFLARFCRIWPRQPVETAENAILALNF